MNEMISVVMPVYNAEKYIAQAIESILNQTYPYFEFIIVDDGSEDNSVKIIESFEDERIRLFRKKHSGISETLNFGISKSQGEYIARMDADDISLPNRFQAQIKFLLQNKNYKLVSSNASIINEKGNLTGYKTTHHKFNGKIKKILHKMFNPIVHSSLMFKREITDDMSFYNPVFDGAEDYDLWLRLIEKYNFYILKESLLYSRWDFNNISLTDKSYKQALKALITHKYFYEKDQIVDKDVQEKIFQKCDIFYDEKLQDVFQLRVNLKKSKIKYFDQKIFHLIYRRIFAKNLILPKEIKLLLQELN